MRHIHSLHVFFLLYLGLYSYVLLGDRKTIYELWVKLFVCSATYRKWNNFACVIPLSSLPWSVVFFFSLSFSFCIRNLLCINKEKRKSWMIKIKPQNYRFWAGSNEKTPKKNVKQPDLFHTPHKNLSKCYTCFQY